MCTDGFGLDVTLGTQELGSLFSDVVNPELELHDGGTQLRPFYLCIVDVHWARSDAT